MKGRYASPIRDKWVVMKTLLNHDILRLYTPETKKWSKAVLQDMLRCHRMVYVKPNRGAKGIGVMRVEIKYAEGTTSYVCRVGTLVAEFRSFGELYTFIRSRIRQTPYLVQQGIWLTRHDDRPFDLRLMVQRNPRGKWKATGIVARVAAPDRIVTNGSQGGISFPAGEALAGYWTDEEEKQRHFRKWKRLGRLSAKHMQKKFPNLKEIGLDLGLDETLKPWILEINFRPDPVPFAKLSNHGMLFKIVKYGAAYGRIYPNVKRKFPWVYDQDQ
jgi:hypothetical protein